MSPESHSDLTPQAQADMQRVQEAAAVIGELLTAIEGPHVEQLQNIVLGVSGYDQHWFNLAKTEFHTAFMFLRKAIANQNTL